MKAVLVHELGSIDNGEVAEVPLPVPGPGQLLIEVHAAPVNFVDIVTITGKYQFKPKLPYTPGKGPAGVVMAVGEGVERFKPGDRVLGMAEYGGYAEAALLDEAQTYRLPDTLSFVDAAAMSLAFDTAWMALRDRGRIAAGDNVLVLGATGAVGNAAVQLARAMGAAAVMGTASSPDKAKSVVAAGAHAVIDLSRPNLREGLREQVFEATHGHGADVIIDPLGGDVFDAAIRAIAWRGRMVVVGFAAGGIPTLKVNYLLLKNAEVSGLQISDYRRRMPDLVRTCWEETFAFHAQGKVKAPETVTFPLSRFAEAMHLVESRKSAGRVVLKVR
ncbi:MAG: NADPH:quinone oxidoreductase family protein [Hyphomicrobiaceae bacterium]